MNDYMEAKDFLKSKYVWVGITVADMNAPENYFKLEDLLEEYHQLKLLQDSIKKLKQKIEHITKNNS